MKYRIIGFKRSFGIIFLAALLVAAGSVLYWKQVTKRLVQDARASIAIGSRELVENFNRLLGAELQVLTALSVSLEAETLLEAPSKLVGFLNKQNRRNSFDLTGVQLPDGKVFFSNGAVINYFLSKKEVAYAYEHSHYISSRRKDPFSEKDILVLAIPLRINGEKKGLVFATQSIEYYAQALKDNAMHGEGLAFVVTPKGEVVVSYPKVSFKNIFEMGQQAVLDKGIKTGKMQQDLLSGKEGMIGYSLNGQHRFSSYLPLGYNGWFGLSVLPTESMAEKAQKLVVLSLALCLSVIGILGVLLIFILRLQYQSSRALYRMGFVDPLTQADNLNAFRMKFSKEADNFKEQQIPFALVLVNVNHFKAVNDIYGFEQGDLILKQVSDALQAELKEGELVCRSGADVFLMLMACPNRDQLAQRIEMVTRRAGRFCRKGGECLPLSLTCGVYVVDEDIPFYIMMDRANLAWASAKGHAGQIYAFYDEAYRRQIVAEKNIESVMEQALADKEFVLYLQPKCDFKTGEIKSAEALVRWNRPQKGLMAPDLFIPVFEKNGFILKLDLFILKECLQLLKKWKENNQPLIPIGVNFSRLHLQDPSFIETLVCLTDQYGIAHSLIEVELTESIVFGDVARMQQVMAELHEKGFSVAMDDFGSGYSSLNILKNLYFDCVKMDKDFLASGDENPRMKKIISSMVSMIKSLGSCVVAEGVETQEQVEFLRSIGCDLAQGYLFSRPLPTDEFEKLFKKEEANK